jgi:hypothetical protein
MAIEASDIEDEDFSFFDECSFTTTSTSTAAYSNIIYEEEEEEDEEYYQKIPDIDSLLLNDNSERLLNQYFDSFEESNTMSFVADNQLSPLQLPTQASTYDNRHIREESYDSTGTVVLRKPSCQPARPSSFLSSTHTQQYLSRVAEEDRINWDETSFIFPDYSLDHQNGKCRVLVIYVYICILTLLIVYRSVHPYHCSRMGSEAEIFCQDDSVSLNEDEVGSNFSSNSKVVVMKISKNQCITYSTGSYMSADEGYDDEDDEYPCKELPIESASVFLPLSDQEQELLMRLDNRRQLAAIKIQSVWRGYQCRKETKTSSLKLSHRVLAGLAQVNDSIHRRNNNQLQDRIYMLEQRLGEETAMRIAFEKAMEDMTVLMDHQHRVLHDRVEQEVSMRQTYERKMEQAMAQVQPLESRLRHEAKARADLESMMSRVLDQLHDMKVQVKEEAEQRKVLQQKLDSAVEEIASLKQIKKQQPTIRSTAMSRNVSSVTQAPPARSVSRLSTTTGRNSPLPTKTPISSSRLTSNATVRSTPSRLSNRSTDVKRSTTATPTSTLRKTVINRK